MTERQGRTPPRRPESARPRQDAITDSEESPEPTRAELEAIERHRIDWMAVLGATIEELPGLEAQLVRPLRKSGPPFVARVRWPAGEVPSRIKDLASSMIENGDWPSLVTATGLTEPPAVEEHLTASGWLRVGTERIMWTRHPTEPPHLEPGLRIEAVTTKTSAECVRLETEVFGLIPDAMAENAELLADAVARGATRAFIVRRIHEPVASARLVPGPVVAGLHAIGVLAKHRGRGYGRLVTAVATRAGLATRHRLVWLSVDEGNAPAVGLYTSLGYRPAFEWSRWIASR